MQEIRQELQERIDYTKNKAAGDANNQYANRASFEKWSVENCAEIYAVNNVLYGGAKFENLFINTKFFSDGDYAEPCKNCRITFEGVRMAKGE